MKKLSRKNKGVTLLLVLTMAASAMTGCGSKENSQTPATEIDFAGITGGDTQARECTAVRLQMNGLMKV